MAAARWARVRGRRVARGRRGPAPAPRRRRSAPPRQGLRRELHHALGPEPVPAGRARGRPSRQGRTRGRARRSSPSSHAVPPVVARHRHRPLAGAEFRLADGGQAPAHEVDVSFGSHVEPPHRGGGTHPSEHEAAASVRPSEEGRGARATDRPARRRRGGAARSSPADRASVRRTGGRRLTESPTPRTRGAGSAPDRPQGSTVTSRLSTSTRILRSVGIPSIRTGEGAAPGW